ncbi:hypothetical protein M3197_16410 [Sporosarcina aquimarina]|uniref:hypothetical protein n=1 Tax=Sporosarcina aquimarina TaxID=114975 RepID=UPI00203DA554|nr:hypothetical protein [Sporosarcina aquimarina]MCM3759023.1 hypothetical protein [Sporosarcina aquimarina]
MKKYVLLMLFATILLLAACSKGERDEVQGYSSVIGHGAAMGYQYIVVKEQDTFSWDISYKGNTLLIEENEDNVKNLENFMFSVNESELELGTLIISFSYFVLVVITALILYKKKSVLLKGSGTLVIILAGALGLYFSLVTAVDLSSLLHEILLYDTGHLN